MRSPNQTFHQEQEAKTLITYNRPSHPALGDPSGNVLALIACISSMTFMPVEVGGGRLLFYRKCAHCRKFYLTKQGPATAAGAPQG